MKPTYLQLLALCQYALASPCKPSVSSVSSALSTTTTEAVSESILQTTESTVISIVATTSAEPSPTSVEPSTTTSSGPQQPTNLLRNAGFEDDTVAPWELPRGVGTISVSNVEVHGGSQSGYMTGAPGGPANLGFRQPLDSLLIKPNTNYQFSVWVKTTSSSGCFTQGLSCGTGTAVFGQTNFGGPLNEWVFATATCSWTQDRLDAGASVLVTGTCERLSFYADDATLVEVQ
ncbi:uncharacterized protein B0J16DRAFT_346087 [Fusarium flagelliforme]|uniref:uncharacterized protein n=1 Tax=Fusarium flagelliforme TaxID=2675880 RepID=UPI001E8CB878|nr:uncharacterized protein B0J16DRAFT_346087 [Fusarium flagelliforme]KAH7183672.1 hypothetical protein B0J16DRAFT_346087 [Fusarium flagelliforme]